MTDNNQNKEARKEAMKQLRASRRETIAKASAMMKEQKKDIRAIKEFLKDRDATIPEIAGKTGTTQNQSDGWFMGITPQLTTGIWVGCEDRSAHFRSISLGQGANMALPIWALYMQRVYADTSLHITKDPFPLPSKPLSVEIDCEKYEQQQQEKNFFIDTDDF